MIFPWKGIFKWINPGPFNSLLLSVLDQYPDGLTPRLVKEHVAIIIMSSAVSTSAAAIQAISVQELIFPVLTGVSNFCLADNNSSVVRNVFGGADNNEGMGLLAWCFDWNYTTSNCVWIPTWYQINMDIGICLTYIFMSAVYWGNLWQAKQFPFMSQAIFAEDGTEYNQTALLTNGRFDPEN
ncbi:hypothetical protein AcV5_002620 [Taiwanofungus camphoratus]|nr:hypothetical protein AcV5_002620 [Antrodia cinnamomea]